MSTRYVTPCLIILVRNKFICSSFHAILSFLIIYLDTITLMELIIERIALDITDHPGNTAMLANLGWENYVTVQ